MKLTHVIVENCGVGDWEDDPWCGAASNSEAVARGDVVRDFFLV